MSRDRALAGSAATELLQRLGARPLIEVGQFGESLGFGKLLRLVLVGDDENGVVGLEH